MLSSALVFLPRTTRRIALFGLLSSAVAFAVASCHTAGSTLGIRTRILQPQGIDAFAGLASVDVFVKQFATATAQTAETVGVATFSPDEPWTLPDTGASRTRPLFVEVFGKNAAGEVVRAGRTRVIDPAASKGKVFGIFFSNAGEYAPMPSSPAKPRSRAGVVALDDGRVILAGGLDAAGNGLTSVEMYDPDDGTWTALASLSAPRLEPGIAALASGQVLVAGGLDPVTGNELSSAEYVVPPSSAPTTLPSAPNAMLKAWRAMRSARLPSGKILFAGGFATDTANRPVPTLFDPATGTWQELVDGVYAAGAGVAALPGGRVAIVGGTSGGAVLDNVQIAVESASGVSLGGPASVLRLPRTDAAVVAVTFAGGATKILVSGGATQIGRGRRTAAVELLDVSGAIPTSSFAGERDTRHRAGGAVVRLGDGRILLAGGFGGAAATSEVWDPGTQHADETPLIPAGRTTHSNTAVALGDGTALLAGGDDAADTWIFNPAGAVFASGTRATLAITPILGIRAAGTVLEGASALRLRFFDSQTLVDERNVDASTSPIVLPLFRVDNQPLFATLEAVSATGGVLAWGATAYTLGTAAQASGTLSILLGRAGEFVESPVNLPSVHGDGAAAILADGRVVVVAGLGGESATDSFDPTDGTSSPVNGATIPVARKEVRATVAAGRLFVTGGAHLTGTPADANSLFNLQTKTWTAANSPGTRYHHELVTLANGNVLSTGNESAGLPQPVSDLWTGAAWAPIAGTPGSARSRHQATLLDDGRVLVTGGLNTNGTIAVISVTAELYEPSTQSYALVNPMIGARRDHVAFAYGIGKALVCGGRPIVGGGMTVATCERFDEATGSFTAGGLLSAARDDMAVAKLLDGRTMIIGGQIANGSRVTNVDLFTPSTAAVSAGPPLVSPRSATQAVRLADGRVVVAGGVLSNSVALDSVEVYTPPLWTNPFGY